MAELGDQQLGGVLVDRLGDRDRHAHLEQCLDQVGGALGHAVGQFLDGDRFGNDDVADLLGGGAGLLVVRAFPFRATRRSAARLRARLSSSPDRARLTVSLPEWRRSSLAAGRARRLGTLGRGGCRPDGGGRALRRRRAAELGLRRGAASGAASDRRGASASSATRLARRRLPRRGDCLRRGASRPRVCSTLTRSSRRRASSSWDMRASSASRSRRFLRAHGVTRCRPPARGARRGGRGGRPGRRLGRFGNRLGLGRLGGGASPGLAENAALLDLDHHGVRAAMAEALLDLAGLNRALEAQRRPGAKLRLFGLVGHSIPSSMSSAEPGAEAGSPPSSPVRGSVKARHRASAWDTRVAAAGSVSATCTTFSRPRPSTR